MDHRRVFLGMPSYDGNIAPDAARSYWNATACTDVVRGDVQERLQTIVDHGYHEGSLLACAFNMLWCDALNMKLVRKEQLDYFAMQHPDVGGDLFWVDTLIDEMEALDLDMLGVVVPIKDMRGRTSIALERPDGDPWRPLCRLTLPEVYRLPETFTAEDVGHPLLLNTGMWVCRFTDRIAKAGLYFTVNDRIIFDRVTKEFVPKCEPEDWNWSRQFNKLGLRIGATRKVKITHRGRWEFGNAYPWGDDHDSEYQKTTVVPDDGFRFPFEIDGWLTFEEGKALWRLAKDKEVLEIGSYCGLSTVCLAQSAKHVDSVDTHDGRGTAVERLTLEKFLDNIERYELPLKVRPHVQDSKSFTEEAVLAGKHYDLIFIDGAHDLASVTADIEYAKQLIAPGGIILFHDYHSAIDPDVTTAVDDYISASGAELLSTHDSLAVVRTQAAVPLEV